MRQQKMLPHKSVGPHAARSPGAGSGGKGIWNQLPFTVRLVVLIAPVLVVLTTSRAV